jgi:hypothetical protein
LYCKNCGGPLKPKLEMLNSDDPYYREGARCPTCNYLYFPDFPGSWNSEAWITDFDHKAEIILQRAYTSKNDWRRDVYLTLNFIDHMDNMVTWYFSSPEFDEHEHLLEILKSLNAAKTIDTLQHVVQLARRPEQVLERFGLVGDTSERVDDAWEEVTGELAESMDADLRQRVYNRFMRDHDIADFAAV